MGVLGILATFSVRMVKKILNGIENRVNHPDKSRYGIQNGICNEFSHALILHSRHILNEFVHRGVWF